MAMALASLLDPQRLARLRGRLHAWWEGEEFDECAFQDADARDPRERVVSVDRVDFPWPPRLAAMIAVWGEHRLRPGSAEEEQGHAIRMKLGHESVLAVIGPGLAEPVIVLARAFAGRVEAFEWRAECAEGLAFGITKANFAGRVGSTLIDLDAHAFKPGGYDGVYSVDDFAFCANAADLAQRIAEALKPGGCAIVETYVREGEGDLGAAFDSSFASTRLRTHRELLSSLTGAGLVVEADDDLTYVHAMAAKDGFASLFARLSDEGAPAGTMAELAIEIKSWRERLPLMLRRRVQRRRLTLRKPKPPQADQRYKEVLGRVLQERDQK
jgi:SAM-dependent methyltransferase